MKKGFTTEAQEEKAYSPQRHRGHRERRREERKRG
jgi:hypothetical protein